MVLSSRRFVSFKDSVFVSFLSVFVIVCTEEKKRNKNDYIPFGVDSVATVVVVVCVRKREREKERARSNPLTGQNKLVFIAFSILLPHSIAVNFLVLILVPVLLFNHFPLCHFLNATRNLSTVKYI